MRLDNFDLNLLIAFDILVEERSVTRAARRLNLTQSATSAALKRLREAMQDEILVQHGKKMIPTPHALRLAPQVTAAIAQLRSLISASAAFDPLTSSRQFRMEASDYITTVLLVPLLSVLAREAPGACIEVLSNVHEVAGPGLPFAQRSDLVFVGGFRHPPNVDAVRWFVESIFPRVRDALPNVRFHCIGGDVGPAIEALREHDGVVVHGYVPDITPYMDGCRIAIAPLRFGAGVKGKINLSMAHGQPVVATSCAAEGMHLVDGRDVLVADDAAGFADAVVRAYTDRALWERLAGNGLDNITRHFSADAARGVVRRVFFD